METRELKKKGIVAVFWNLSGTVMKQGVAFVISVFLARMLSPSDFGLVGMATVFVALTQSFTDFGMTSGLIQKKDPTEVQYSTVFYINLGLSVVLMIVMISLSGVIAGYYNNEEVGRIARFVSYSFVINALNGVQNAQLTKALANKVKAIASLSSAVVGGITGIAFAFAGFGAWSLVYSALAGSVVNTAIIWKSSAWRPGLLFNFAEVKPLLHFGSKMFASGLLDSVYSKIDVLVIGKIFSPSILGYYYRAISLNQLITRYTSGALQGVFFPVVSHLQTNKDAQVRVITKSLHIMSFLSFMLMGILYLDAKELIILLFTEKWLVSVDYFKVMVFYAYAYPISVVLVNVLSGNGQSGQFFRLEVWKKMAGLTAMGVGFFFGMYGFLWGLAISSTIAVVLNMWFVSKVISLPVLPQIRMVYQYAMYCVIAVLPVLWVKSLLPDNLWLLLFAGTTLYIIVYSFLNKLFSANAITYLQEYFVQLRSSS